MDEIFRHNITTQDSLICKISPETLQAISKFLSPHNLVDLSHTCKDLHLKLPFYLIKSGRFSGRVLNNINFSRTFFEGPAIHFLVNQLNISLRCNDVLYLFWVQIVRGGKVVLKTEKFKTEPPGCQFTKDIPLLGKYKPGDRIFFMIGTFRDSLFLDFPYIADINYKISLQLKNYEYGKPIYFSQKRSGYAEFTSPSVLKIPGEIRGK